MIRTTIVIAAGLVAFAATLPAMPAHAARARVFVASYGSDSNPCTFGSPCKTFQHAHDTVAAGGEITAIDSAGFGPIMINKAVTITSPNGVEAGIVPAAGGDGIQIINADPNAKINLRGLVLDGVGTGSHGIYFATSTAGSGILTIQDCVIRNFLDVGIGVYASGQSAYISNTTISNISGGIGGGTGVAIVSYQTSHATLNRVEIVGNDYGMLVDGDLLPDNGINWVSMNDSIIASSKLKGIDAANNANGNPHTYVTVTVTRSSIVDGAGTGIYTGGTGTVVQLNQSTVANNASGSSTNIGGAVTSFGNNVFSDLFGSGDEAPPVSGLK